MEKYYIGKSNIHGKGVIAKKNLRKDEVVDKGIGFNYCVIPYVTPHFGSFINHSYTPSAYLWYYEDDNTCGWYVRALRPIKWGEEITVDYNNTPWYIEGPLPHYV